MKKDDIKTFVVVISVSIICIVIILLFNIKSNMEKLAPVNEYNSYFANIEYLNEYLNSTSNDNLYDLLDKKYIEDNDINLNNMHEKVKSYPALSSVSLSSMDYVKVGSNYLYYIKGSVTELKYNSEEVIDDNFNVLLFVDYNNLSFSVYPVYDNYKKIINSIKKINIEKNGNNGLHDQELVTNERICVMYLSDFLDRINKDIDKSYDLLSDEMKKTYTTLDSYKNYINDNKEIFSTTADMCKLDNFDDARVYSVIDENGNRFVFSEKYILNYKASFYLNYNAE